jgi:sugar phosphate isomerase/epimerase
LDLWIPVAHFADAAKVERAVEAAVGAVELAGDLARLMGEPGAEVVAMTLPDGGGAAATVAGAAERCGVRVADHRIGEKEQERSGSADASVVGVGIDPAALLMRGMDPGAAAARTGGRLVQARMSDANDVGRVPVGKGSLDVLGYVGGLVAAGVSARPVVVDLRGLADQAAGARAALASWSSS